MASEWLKLVSVDDGKPIYLNLANACVIKNLDTGGARVWFLEETKNSVVDVKETSDEILRNRRFKLPLRIICGRGRGFACEVSATSTRDPHNGWNPCARCYPPVIRLEFQAELVVKDH